MTAQDEGRQPVWRDTLKDAMAGLGREERRLFPRLARELLAILDRAAPLEAGADYGFLVDGLLLRLVRGAPVEELASWLQAELTTIGGGDVDPARTEPLAAVIHVWFGAARREGEEEVR